MVNREEVGENFCPLPFLALQAQPTGNVAPCCWNQGTNLGNVQSETFLEIWNNEKTQELRREFLSGSVQSCATQIKHIGCHKYFEHLLHLVELKEIQSQPPRKLDVRLNGKCNLECVMCDVWKQPNGLYDRSGFWERGPAEIFPYLVELDVLGGEPFVQKDTFRLIDEVSRVNPDCAWAFVTNGQWKFNNVMKEKLDRIKIRWMQVSLDSMTPENYLKIRRKGLLSKTLETLQALAKYRDEREKVGKPFRLNVSFCVQEENWREIPAFLKYCKGLGVFPILQHIFEPGHLSLSGRPRAEREEIVTFLEKLLQKTGESCIWQILSPMRESLLQS